MANTQQPQPPAAAADSGPMCEQFEGAWRKNVSPPPIRDFLGDTTGPARASLLRELVRLDNYYRRQAGTPRTLEQYLREFPELRQPDGTVPRDLLNDFPDESRSGDAYSTVTEGTAPRPVTDAPLRTIGRYVLVGALGSGGQAEVYRALHPALGKEVVLKVSREALAGEPAVAGLLAAEGRILAGLEHPNLAHVYDLDVYNGRPFLVMEYVRGRTLEQAAREERYEPRQAAALVAQVARAVAAAHRQGVVHQDIKPRNILIDESGRPRLIDFGLARLEHAWAEGAEGPSGGTPAYAAPEQARGEVTRVGPATDVFGLGGVLFYLLAGKAPFTGKNSAETLDRACRCAVDWPALSAAGAPRRLEAVCRRALAEEPGQRYPSALALAEDLDRFARRPGRVGLALAAAAVLSLVLAVVWLATRGGSPAAPASPALSVRVGRGGMTSDLLDAVPLHDGDELQVQARLPRGASASLFLINGRGELQHLHDEAAQDADRDWSYPPSGKFAPLGGPPGTEVLLLCLRRSGPTDPKEVRQLWGAGGDWPALPAGSVLGLDNDEVKAVQHGRDLGAAHDRADPESEVRHRLEALRQALRQHGETLAGVAFAHRERSP